MCLLFLSVAIGVEHVYACQLRILIIIFVPTSTKPRAWKLSKMLNNGCNTSVSVFIVLRKETAFPRCRAMDRRWNRNTTAVFLCFFFLLLLLSKSQLIRCVSEIFVVSSVEFSESFHVAGSDVGKTPGRNCAASVRLLVHRGDVTRAVGPQRLVATDEVVGHGARRHRPNCGVQWTSRRCRGPASTTKRTNSSSVTSWPRSSDSAVALEQYWRTICRP